MSLRWHRVVMVVVAPTAPMPAQWSEPSDDVGRCVEHLGRA